MGIFDRFRKKDERAPTSKSEMPQPTRRPAPTPTPAMQPQQMPQVKEMPVEELKAKLDRGEKPLIIDVRENWEYQLVHLEQAVHVPMREIPATMNELDKDAEIVVHCHHGGRSYEVSAYLMQNGFTNVKNLTGGIDSWARRIDPSLRTY